MSERTMVQLLQIIVALAACVASPVYSDVGSLKIIPNVREILLKEGATQVLNCSIESSNRQQTNWTIPSPVGVTITKQSQIIPGDIYRIHHILTIKSFSAVNAGDYICQLADKDKGSITATAKITLNAVTENKTEPVFVYDTDNKEDALACTISFKGQKEIKSVEWLKNDTKISDLSGSKERFVEVRENNTLIIKNPKRDDAGLYVARFRVANMSRTYDCEVKYTAAPFVLKFDMSKNLIQDEDLDLQCQVKGYPHAVVTWYKDQKLLNISKGENERIKQLPLNGYQNARLQIDNVEFSDAGEYTCEAHSIHFNSTASKSITVRVKDRLAALWPFLGIVGEVVLLCTIIFIYEKRRNKQAEQEENTAQEADGTSADKKEGLRHRNTPANNPSA